MRLPQCARVDAYEAIAHHYLPVTTGTGTRTFLAGNFDDEEFILRGKTLLAALVKEKRGFSCLASSRSNKLFNNTMPAPLWVEMTERRLDRSVHIS